MTCMYTNAWSPKRDFGDISQPTNWNLDSGATCNMTPDISDLIPVLLVEIDKYIEVVDGHFVKAKKKEKLK